MTRWTMTTVYPLLASSWQATLAAAAYSFEQEQAANAVIRELMEKARLDVRARLQVGIAVTDLHVRGDVVYDPATNTDLVTLRWMPENCPVELVGGQHDGGVLPLPAELGRDIYLTDVQSPPLPEPVQRVQLPLPQSLAEGITRYRFDGWNPHRRRWVYTTR